MSLKKTSKGRATERLKCVVWEVKNVVNGINVKNSDTNEEENFHPYKM